MLLQNDAQNFKLAVDSNTVAVPLKAMKPFRNGKGKMWRW